MEISPARVLNTSYVKIQQEKEKFKTINGKNLNTSYVKV